MQTEKPITAAQPNGSGYPIAGHAGDGGAKNALRALNAMLAVAATCIMALAGCHTGAVALRRWRRPHDAATIAKMHRPPFAMAEKDPNQTAAYVYYASYGRTFSQAQAVLRRFTMRIDQHDYRFGLITSRPTIAPQMLEPWRRDQTGFDTMMENTVNLQRFIVRVRIARAVKKHFLQIAVQVKVQREENPQGTVSGPVFTRGSGFGANPLPLASAYASPASGPAYWKTTGRDPPLERRILKAILKRV